jgi:hypothetical protein
MVVEELHRDSAIALIHWVCAIIICRKFTNTVSQILQVALSMEQQWCGKTEISIHPQKVQHLMKPGHLRLNLLAGQ